MADDDSPIYKAIMESQGVPAGSSRSPAEEALEAMEQVDIYLSWVPPGHAQAARAAADKVRSQLAVSDNPCEEHRNVQTGSFCPVCLLQRAESAESEVSRLTGLLEHTTEGLRRIATAVEAWDNDETPDEDFPFRDDADFVNFCGHVARALLAVSSRPPGDTEGEQT